jgi:hypothetical protein
MLAAMCAVLAVSTTAASPAHRHSDAPGSDCDLCCVGHLPAVQARHSSDLGPCIIFHWRPAGDEFLPIIDPHLRAAASRAPPL